MKKVFLLSAFAMFLAASTVMAGDKKECARACTKEHGGAACCKKKDAACCKKKDAACCKKHEEEKAAPAPTNEKK